MPTWFQKAVNNGLLALVADGVHKLNPRTERRAPERMEEGQLYTIHGVYRGGFEVPLLFAVTRNKSEDDYVTIFGKMKEAVQAVPSDTPNTEPQLRIVVDFKMAAINAARAVFPLSSTEGCAWHLTQAWVRNRNRLGLLRFLKGGERDPRVVHWGKTLKGLPFLPRDHFHLVNALTVVPVEHSHPAYEPCQNFLDYFNRTWMRGPFESMWCKYLVKELRTTNLAENFHGRLRGLFSGKKHPKFDELITMLQEITAAAASRMNRMVE
ncbi:hypothetical protein ANCCAN_18895, partial [Ancylostoma caninum]